jgi:hypothetical protein
MNVLGEILPTSAVIDFITNVAGDGHYQCFFFADAAADPVRLTRFRNNLNKLEWQRVVPKNIRDST